MNSRLNKTLENWTERGYLHLASAILFEALLIGFTVFAGLFTMEILLPTFVTARLSLALFFLLLLLGLWLFIRINERAGISFAGTITLRHPLMIAAIVWGSLLLFISLIKFPLWSIPFLAGLFLATGYFFWKIFLDWNEEKEI